ncbi:MAG: methyltransferase domain-containing protein [Gemmataceae bacterium]|nr:methyltransferase domain-containing protein [Gemmata sp.]MDW8197784.1 methyltransferase domain-containing protein [Gemmataceae bacterium]
MLWPPLRSRRRIAELMDDPALDPVEHRRALAGLARLNRFSNSAGVLWPEIAKLARCLQRPLRVLDVATGRGDIPRQLLTRASRAGLSLEVAACDLSPTAIAEATREPSPIRFFVHDAVRQPLPGGFDVVMCSLFVHHLEEMDAVRLLRNMAAAGQWILVNDLVRSRFSYCAVWLACRLLTRSPVVRYDGPASVCSAFTPPEMRTLAQQAGLTQIQMRRRFPCRLLLIGSNPSGSNP